MLGGTLLREAPAGAATLTVTSGCDDPERLASAFSEVLHGLPYYNERAKLGESQKYTASRLAAAAAADPESVLVAEIDGQLAGFLFNHLDDETVWLSWFGVRPDFRRRGVGGALLRGLDLRAKKVESHKIWCDSRTDNEKSQTILTRHGYVQLCTLRNHWYRQDFILWEKRVS